MIHIIQKVGGSIEDSFLDEGFILEKKIGVGQPKRVFTLSSFSPHLPPCLTCPGIENAKILIANTPMDTDKIKIFGAKVECTYYNNDTSLSTLIHELG